MFNQIKDCKCEKNRGEILLPCRHQTGDGSTVSTLDERETQGYSIEHLIEDGFCKENHYIEQQNHCKRRSHVDVFLTLLLDNVVTR